MIWILMIGVFILDQLSKYYISHAFQYLESVPVIPKVFYLTYVHNYGAAFGILQNKRMFFIIISVLVVGVFFFFYRQLPKDRLTKLAVGLALGGTFGNLIDRIRLGYVVDFFDFRVWPVFNIADSAIVVGMILLAWQILFNEEERAQVAESTGTGDFADDYTSDTLSTDELPEIESDVSGENDVEINQK